MKKFGFTLAEVLITLSIIGVVAALTVPSVISRNNEVETVTKVKKSFSTFSQAYNMAIAQNGMLNINGQVGTGDGASVLANNFIPHLRVIKNCGTEKGCFPDVTYKYLNGTNFINMDESVSNSKFRLGDGTSIAFYLESNDCTSNKGTGRPENSVCGVIEIDVNGDKGPNVTGKDYFAFYISKSGIIPFGVSDNTIQEPQGTDCDIKTNGYGCAAWIIEKGNMDYLE